jgi:hypothetical protein
MLRILRGNHARRRRAAAVVAVAALLGVVRPSAAETLTVVLDRATVIRLPDKVQTVVIGNPLIADVSLQSGGMLVITGKGYGLTNLLALDRNGAVLVDRAVAVQGPREDVVVIYRGVERETWSCTPFCERRAMLGDAGPFFEGTLGQIGLRNGLAQGAAQQASSPK